MGRRLLVPALLLLLLVSRGSCGFGFLSDAGREASINFKEAAKQLGIDLGTSTETLARTFLLCVRYEISWTFLDLRRSSPIYH